MFNRACNPQARSLSHTAPIVVVHRDTRAWRMQIWISFAVAVTPCAAGLSWLPGADLDRAFMVMGYVFCLSTAFALSKYVHANERRKVDTPMWGGVVWSGFALAMVALTGWGLWRMDINPTCKAYLLVSWLFLISSAFTLAKTLCDAHEHRVRRPPERGTVLRPHRERDGQLGVRLAAAKRPGRGTGADSLRIAAARSLRS